MFIAYYNVVLKRSCNL